MSNSPLVNYTRISPNSTNPRRSAIKKITPHHMAGNLTVESCGNVFATTARKASSHYGIGTDGRVGMYVEEKNRAWTSSSSANDDQAVTIEVANDEVGGNWHVSDKALAKLIDLCTDICQRNGIKKLTYTGDSRGNLTTHNMFTPTNCPGPYLESKLPYVADEVNKRLGIIVEPDKNGCPYGTSTALVKDGSVGTHVKRCQWYLSELGYNVGLIDGICGRKTVNEITNFQIVKGLEADGICGAQTWAALESAFVIIEEDGDMDGKTIYEKLNEYLAERKVPDWAIKELEEAKQMGITDGTDPMQFIPRYQAAIMAKRAIEAAR